ncbi:exported hypothetical protein [Vibrio coralliirubri]|uniref:Uncharacterized protein n=1 Tax=Vibrio coralliirubri TaxID=1516159 RepID=A0AA86XRP1_9VIBR|nr:exported hypothetical protein [Vibrio coralliirubri]CDT70912.1 exported hypothetical protein [Vibrio coralliirubri]
MRGKATLVILVSLCGQDCAVVGFSHFEIVVLAIRAESH